MAKGLESLNDSYPSSIVNDTISTGYSDPNSSNRGSHTPGPWAMNPLVARVDAFTSDGAVPVCQLLWPTELRSEAETEANAHLIEAAPDMLAALKLIGGLLGEKYRNCERTSLHDNDCWAAYSHVIAAIAKAQGEA